MSRFAVNPDLTRARMGATRLNIPLVEYLTHLAADEKWCSGHGRWEDRSRFGPHKRRPEGLDTVCREFSRENARKNMRRLYWQRKEQAS